MRAQRNGSSSSFETRARSLVFAERLRRRAPQDEDEHRAQFLFTFQTAHLVPAARFAPGFCIFGFAHPDEGWRSAESRRVLARHPWPALGGRQAPWRRRLASHTGDARLPAL